MADTKKIEEKVSSLEKQLDEARSVIARLASQLRDTTEVAGVLNRDVAELKNSLKRIQNWGKVLEEKVLHESKFSGISRYE